MLNENRSGQLKSKFRIAALPLGKYFYHFRTLDSMEHIIKLSASIFALCDKPVLEKNNILLINFLKRFNFLDDIQKYFSQLKICRKTLLLKYSRRDILHIFAQFKNNIGLSISLGRRKISLTATNQLRLVSHGCSLAALLIKPGALSTGNHTIPPST